jgi:hypothetical protein
MSRVIGTVVDGNRVVAKDTLIDLRPNAGPTMGFFGSFVLGPGDAAPHTGSKCTLTTSDGRSGDILIARISAGSGQSTTVDFQTTGPFQ